MLQKKSRIFVILAVLALIMALVACGGDTAPAEEAPAEAPAAEEAPAEEPAAEEPAGRRRAHGRSWYWFDNGSRRSCSRIFQPGTV